jgi:hypothetical protein
MEMKTTTAAVIAILKTSSNQNERSGNIISEILCRHPEVRAQRTSKDDGLEAAKSITSASD